MDHTYYIGDKKSSRSKTIFAVEILAGWSAEKFNDTGRVTDPSNICSLVTTAIRSCTFWGYAKLIDTLAGAIDIQSSWAEGCSCHELDLKDNKWYRSRIKAVGQKLGEDAAGEGEGASEVGAAAVLPAPSASHGVNREPATYQRETMEYITGHMFIFGYVYFFNYIVI